MRTRPTWVIFDAADTLLTAVPSVDAVYQRIGAEFGSVVTTAEIKRRFNPAIRTYFHDGSSSEESDRRRWKELVFDVLQTSSDVMFDAIWEHFARSDHWRLFDDVTPAWRWLTQCGYRLAIASNFDLRLLKIVASFSELSPEHVFLSTQLGYRKPCINFFRCIERKLGVAPDQLLLIGDSTVADFDGARAAGWQSLLIDRSLGEDAGDAICRLTSLQRVLA
jgi:putative hydrolase of the HAD superfamily